MKYLLFAIIAVALAYAVSPSLDDIVTALVLAATVPMLGLVLALQTLWAPALVLLVAGLLIFRMVPASNRISR